jgi:hypothetical protein
VETRQNDRPIHVEIDAEGNVEADRGDEGMLASMLASEGGIIGKVETFFSRNLRIIKQEFINENFSSGFYIKREFLSRIFCYFQTRIQRTGNCNTSLTSLPQDFKSVL